MGAKTKTAIQRLITPRQHMDRLHALFALLLDVFHTHNIFTLAMSGTLLGIVRNNDYILWDDDVDMAVNFSDYARIMNLNVILGPKGIEIANQGYPWEQGQTWRILKVRYIKDPKIFIDLFPFEFKGHTFRMPPRGVVPKSWYRRNVFHVHELYPLQFRKLRDLWVPCPNNAEGFITRSYGEGSVDTCLITHQHLPKPKKGILKHFENSVESFLGIGAYGKKFPCDMIPSDTPPLPPLEHLKWIHWIILIGIGAFSIGVLIIFMEKKRGG